MLISNCSKTPGSFKIPCKAGQTKQVCTQQHCNCCSIYCRQLASQHPHQQVIAAATEC
jgi:hypothetical protein